ncbi:MAG: energy transducer TonB [Bacteroidia bacterium]|nr:energy transducer TonB [Bacteroidia bacterium]
MMREKQISVLGTLKLLIVMSVIALFIVTGSSCGRKKIREAGLTEISPHQLPPPPPKPPTMVGSDTIWDIVDELPLLPGGDELIMKYIARNIHYPETASANGIQGQVVIKFFISSKGNVSGYELVKNASPDLDAEALRVLKTLTKFEPARRDGKPVPSWYYLPITFALK